MNKLKLYFFFLSMFSLWLIAPPALAVGVAESNSDSASKATHILKFRKFVTWPADVLTPGTPITIGIASANGVAYEIADQIAKRPTDQHQIKTVQLQPGDSLEGIHILFVGNDQTQKQLAAWLTQAQGKPILSITDTDNMPSGSIINFVHEGSRIRFDVSLTAAEHAGVKLSAALLTVAREVYGGKK